MLFSNCLFRESMVDQLQNMSHEFNLPQVPLLFRLGPAVDLTARAMAFSPAHFPASSFTGEAQGVWEAEIITGPLLPFRENTESEVQNWHLRELLSVNTSPVRSALPSFTYCMWKTSQSHRAGRWWSWYVVLHLSGPPDSCLFRVHPLWWKKTRTHTNLI